MISALIVDDEAKSREVLRLMISDYCDEAFVVGQAASVDEALERIQRLKPQLILLDIELAGKSAFDLLDKLPDRDCEVVFVTGYEQHARKAILYSGMAYLLKPIDLDELLMAINRVADKVAQQAASAPAVQPPVDKQRIVVPTSSGYTLLEIEAIMYLEADGAYTCMTLKDRTRLLVSKSIGSYESHLAKLNFVRIHRSVMVNMQFVREYVRGRGGYVMLHDGTHLNVSARKRSSLLQALGLME